MSNDQIVCYFGFHAKLKVTDKEMEYFMLNKPLIVLTLALSCVFFTASSFSGKHDFVEFKYQPAPHRYHPDANAKPEDIYNPDLSTGDDDVMCHPDMNIDL
jgi:hypothetical protein